MKILQILVLIVGLAVLANGQNEKKLTVLNGSVIDQMGAAIPETRIVLTNQKGYKFDTFSNENGAYRMSVPAGTYSIEAEYTKHQGWEKFRIENFEIAATAKVSLDITLRVNKKFTDKISEPITGSASKNNNEPAQNTSILTGTLYDATGAVIVKVKVTAINQKGEKFETFTNDEGVYTLNLTYIPVEPGFSYKMAKYDLTVEAEGFEKFTLKDFKVTGKYTNKMQLDFALDVLVISDPITVAPTENKKPK